MQHVSQLMGDSCTRKVVPQASQKVLAHIVAAHLHTRDAIDGCKAAQDGHGVVQLQVEETHPSEAEGVRMTPFGRGMQCESSLADCRLYCCCTPPRRYQWRWKHHTYQCSAQ